jgi:hypothetical protein
MAHPGAFCSPLGATGMTTGANPTEMVCSVRKPGERARWRRNGPPPARTGRRSKKAASTGSATLPTVDTGINPHAVPEPATAPAPARRPTELPPRSTEPLEPPNGDWGVDQGLMHFDSALGRLWNGLGDDQHLTADGRALGNVVKDLGEGITMNRHGSEHALAEMRRLRDQLPDNSRPARLFDQAISRLDAPTRPAPALPDGTPPQLHTLMEDLNRIPLVRRGYDDGMHVGSPFHETDRVADIAGRWTQGQLSHHALDRELRELGRNRHEMSEGWEEINRAVNRATRGIETWGRRPSSGGPRQV